MPNYQDVIATITELTDGAFRKASSEDLAALRTFNLPKAVIDFFALYEPSDLIEGQVRLWPIEAIVLENRDMIPGAYISPLGYVVFSTNICGDTYCFDLNNIDVHGEPSIVLISHEVVRESITAEDAKRLAKPVAKNLIDFLEKFARFEVDEDCIYK